MLSYYKEFAKLSDGDCKRLAVVITHNRSDFVGKWLRAWNNAEHYGFKLAVIHACDKETPNKQEMENILSYNPDFYLPIKNTPLRDFGAFVMLHDDMLPLPEWEQVAIFTDDMLPMRRTFLKPFAEKISMPGVGLVAQCYEPKRMNGDGGHIRTVAYALKREVMQMLELPFWRGMYQGCGHQFEHDSDNHVMNQVIGMGYEVELCHSKMESDNYQHWTSFLDWMWDCHLLEKWSEYWDVYEEQFNPIQKLENYETSTGTLLSMGELCGCAESNPRVSILVPSVSGDASEMAASCLSAIARMNLEKIDRVMFGIGGENEDINGEKHRLADDLLACGVPVSTIRTHGDTDLGTTIDQLVSLSRSDMYMVLMDGCIVAGRGLDSEIEEFRKDKERMLMCSVVPASATSALVLPHPHRSLAVCKKKPLTDRGASWRGAVLPMQFHVGNFVSHAIFTKHLTSRGLLEEAIPETQQFSALEAPVGTFVLDKASKSQGVSSLPESVCLSRCDGGYRESLARLSTLLSDRPRLCGLISRYL